MKPVTMRQVAELLRRLPPDKLAAVYGFISYLIERRESSEAFQTMLASEGVLSRDWDTPEEDEAWADL
jgi:hypothetical protein